MKNNDLKWIVDVLSVALVVVLEICMLLFVIKYNYVLALLSSLSVTIIMGIRIVLLEEPINDFASKWIYVLNRVYFFASIITSILSVMFIMI